MKNSSNNPDAAVAASSHVYILTLSCADIRGIVAAVSGFLAENRCFINQSAQYGDFATGRFFMRTEFVIEAGGPGIAALRASFAGEVAIPFDMQWQMHDMAHRTRVLLMVSKEGHCLNDLLHRSHTGSLPMDVVAVISNHDLLESIVEWHGIPFYHLPVSKENKPQQEAEILRLIGEHEAELVVLARYMQILSPALSSHLQGKAINIHHSFLPSFKGAKPYHQAYDRGVKLIGATAHYVTDDLDEGPIIEQEAFRVDHTAKPEDLVAAGRDIESVVLARAVRYHVEHRVLLNGNKTVVFR